MDAAGVFSLIYQKLPDKAQWKVKAIMVPWHTAYENPQRAVTRHLFAAMDLKAHSTLEMVESLSFFHK